MQRRLQEASREIENYSQYDYILVNEKVEPAIDVLEAIVKAQRLKRSPEPPGPGDDQVLVTAALAERRNMMEQVQTVLATFEESRSHTTTE